MSENGKAMVLAALLVGGLVAYGRCAARSPASSTNPVDAGGSQDGGDGRNAASDNLREGEILPVDERITLDDGVEDVTNQFSAAVMVKVSLTPRETLKCTGVLISPTVVLTAGHCVCLRHRLTGERSGARFVIDGSVCAQQAEVTTVLYRSRVEEPTAPAGSQARTYRARVRVHPALKVFLDEQSLALSSEADLAVAVLDEPVAPPVRPVRLADSEFKRGEVLLVAGYGLDAATDLIHGVRRSGQKEVTRLPEAGVDEALFEAYGAPLTTGSGEPCLRHEKTGVSLAGLTGRGEGATPGCTSIHVHREWLEAELRKSKTSAPGEDGGVKEQ